MNPLHGLGKLHLIADQHDVTRAARHCHQIAKRHLSCFVDEEVVVSAKLLGASKVKGGPTNQADLGSDLLCLVGRPDELAGETVSPSPLVARFAPRKLYCSSIARSSIAASRLLIALWEFDETAIRFPALSRARIACDVVNVLPVPGGLDNQIAAVQTGDAIDNAAYQSTPAGTIDSPAAGH